ncbi:esterase lipase [Levilactobacillus koreensis JCM 16448]|uniref:Esterase n=1 Tax=Levilactobacillus koreensis TaxID=637971 RepID=A0AAC8UX59_9LACO|nr:alpha/beta hydrolase [Levilactobacillus koreensis]AKP64765.1 esterase [Levilactobacillus koreensis]KRK87710.1 esterase lipase [Levilactobacillus koreensis JCM 16448]
MSLRGKWLLFKTQHSQLKQQIQQAFLQPSRQNRAVVPEKFAANIVTEERRVFGGRLLTAASGAPLPQHVLLFHGGAYTMQGIDSHRQLMETLINEANLRVTYVDYPLVPEATVDETVVFAMRAYSYLRAQYPDDQFFLMGDSAGGGLALTLLQQLKLHQEPLPAGTILVSPWTDLSMMNPDLQTAAKHDPYLTLATLKKIGFEYAGEHPVTDPVVSPIYGTFDDLGPVQLYYGTNELLAADDERLLQKFQMANGTPFRVHQMKSMLHDYILWSKLPESKRTLKEIKQFILTGELE